MPHSPLANVVQHIRAWAERSPGATLPDGLLLERFIHQRDEAAFALLVRRHGGLVLSVARRILHDAHAAEDVFQSTFLTLARRAVSIHKHEALPSWLYGVAARLASQARMQEARRKKREQAASSHPPEDVTEAAAWRELGTVLDEELQRLPEKYRTPLVLIYFAGHTQETAARQLDWSLGTLRRRLEHGKRLLHDRLLRRGVSLSIGLLTTAIAQSAVEAALPPWLVERTVQEAVRIVTVQATEWLIGPALLTRSKITLALSLLATLGAGLALSPLALRPAAESDPQASAPRPPETKQPRVERFDDPLPPRALARLGTARFRQGGEVYALTFSRDGKFLASAGGWSDNSVHLWEAATGKEVRQFTGPRQLSVRTVAFSPDDKTLAAGDEGGDLRLWDVKTGRQQRRIALNRSIASLAFSPDGKILALACNDGANHCIFLFDMTKDMATTVLENHHRAPVQSVAFSPDGKTLASGSLDKTIRLWDVK